MKVHEINRNCEQKQAKIDEKAIKKREIDFKYEYNTFLNMVRNQNIKLHLRSSLFNKICIFIGEKTNRKEKRYKNIQTYLEWKRYMNCIFLQNKDIIENIYFLLANKCQSSEHMLEFAKSIALPIYVAQISIAVTILVEATSNLNLVNLFTEIIVLFIMIMLAGIYWHEANKIDFYQECIEIIQKFDNIEITSKQK